ncbi:hypothetical protein HDZ31DRAFT_63769 [Schizophyllum fasciatum]
MLVRPGPVLPHAREPYYPSITLVLAQNGCEVPVEEPRHRRAARRHRCVRKPSSDENRGRLPLAGLPANNLQPAPLTPQKNEDDFLMQTTVFLDEDPWASCAPELQHALGQQRNSSGRLRKIKRFSTLVVDLALHKVRLYTQKFRKDPGL